MTELANIFTPSTDNIFFMSAVAGVCGFVIGFFFKSSIVSKHKKRILTLEDEMLLNHSRILDLEKKLADLKEENTKLGGASSGPKVELKVS